MTRLLPLLLLLAGCESMPVEHGSWQACLYGEWESAEKVKEKCGLEESGGCTINGSLIVTRKPVDWNDNRALYALGHEVAHVLKLNLGHHND